MAFAAEIHAAFDGRQVDLVEGKFEGRSTLFDLHLLESAGSFYAKSIRWDQVPS